LEKLLVSDYDLIVEQEDMLLQQGTINDSSFLQQRAQYRVEDYIIADAPIISGTSNGSYSYEDNSLLLGFENCGWGGRIVNINMLSGDIVWRSTFPMDIDANSVDHYNCTPFVLHGTQRRRAPYEFKFVVEDIKGRRQTYVVEGNGIRKSVHRVAGTSLE
jgi:hypothetical protein